MISYRFLKCLNKTEKGAFSSAIVFFKAIDNNVLGPSGMLAERTHGLKGTSCVRQLQEREKLYANTINRPCKSQLLLINV